MSAHVAPASSNVATKRASSCSGEVEDGERKKYRRDLFGDNYVLEELLHDNGFANVHRASSRTTGKAFVAKVFTREPEDKGQEERMHNEISIKQKMFHPNIARLHEFFQEQGFLYMVMEDIGVGNDLFDHIIEAGHFDEAQTATCMQQLLCAVSYCHENNVCVRDIKPDSILVNKRVPIDNDSLLQLEDFGLAVKFEQGETLRTKVGTAYYVAPEVLSGKYNQSCDLWSCGVVLYIMLCGYPPFAGDTDREILGAVKRGVFSFEKEIWRNVSEDAKSLVSELMKKNIRERYSAEQALSHSWIESCAPTRPASLVLQVSGVKLTKKDTGVDGNNLIVYMHAIGGQSLEIVTDPEAWVGDVAQQVAELKGLANGQRVQLISTSGTPLPDAECIGRA